MFVFFYVLVFVCSVYCSVATMFMANKNLAYTIGLM